MPGPGEDQRAVFLVILLLFILFTPDQTPRRRLHFDNDESEVERQRDFDVLANTTYGDFGKDGYLNLTGFREGDRHHWGLLTKAQDLSRQQYTASWKDLEDVAFYDEIDGQIRGDFKRSALSVAGPSNINLTALDPRKEYIIHHYQRNITEQRGEIVLALSDTHGSPRRTRDVTAEIALHVESAPGTGWEAPMRGVHFPNGAAILTTSSTKFNSLPALPHFVLAPKFFNSSRHVMNETVTKLWEKAYIRDIDLIGVPRCEIILWLQPKPLLGSKRYIELVEHELSDPEGAPIGVPPVMSFSAVLFSPDCGWVLEADNLEGPKAEVFTALTARLILAYAIVLGLQTTILKRQMKKAATPSTRSRIAYPGIALAALGDGLILAVMIAILSIESSSFLIFAAATFFACIHVTFLEVKFVFDIWNVQVGEPQAAEAERERREFLQRHRARQQERAQAQQTANAATETPSISQDSNTTSVISTDGADATEATLPTPAPAVAAPPPMEPDTGATPIPLFTPLAGTIPVLPGTLPTTNIPTTFDLPDLPTPRTTFLTIYTRFYFTLLSLLFISLVVTTLPSSVRTAYFAILSLIYLSLWLPQIHRNVLRNSRKGLAWEFVLLSSLLRTGVVGYWWAVPNNILAITPHPSVAWLLVLWVGLQVAVLASQRWVGARWFVKESWCPKAWEYHPVLVEGLDEEGGTSEGEMQVDLLGSASEAKERGEDGERRCFDCAICVGEIVVPVVQRASSGVVRDVRKRGWFGIGAGAVGRELERASYMVTPCRHIFHAECLEGWMGMRLVCPVCREALPPL